MLVLLLLAAGCSLRPPRALLQETVERPRPEVALPGQERTRPREGLDLAHREFTRGVRRAAAWIDRFLSDERSTEEENRSWVLLGLDSWLESRERADFDLRVRSHVVLPRTEERLRLAFLEDEDELLPSASEAPAAPGDVGTQESEPDLGVQYLLKQTRRNNLRLESGARFEELEPSPYVGIRWRHTWSAESWLVRATERVRLQEEEGVGSRTTLDLERLLSPERFVRETTRVEWPEARPIEWSERIAVYQRSDERLLVLDLEADFVTEPAHVFDEITLRLRVSQRWFEGKLRLEVAPQLAWREEDDYAPTPGLLVRIELGFGLEEPSR